MLSPLVASGEADVILSLELMEALRHIHFLKPGGLVLTNGRMIHPPGETMEVVRKNIESYITAEKVKETIEGLGREKTLERLRRALRSIQNTTLQDTNEEAGQES